MKSNWTTSARKNFPPSTWKIFPAAVARPLAAQFPGLTVRRAFRYSDPQATAVLKASAVEPDVRVVTQDTLSLGEDRTVLATHGGRDHHARRDFQVELPHAGRASTWNPSAARR